MFFKLVFDETSKVLKFVKKNSFLALSNSTLARIN